MRSLVACVCWAEAGPGVVSGLRLAVMVVHLSLPLSLCRLAGSVLPPERFWTRHGVSHNTVCNGIGWTWSESCKARGARTGNGCCPAP